MTEPQPLDLAKVLEKLNAARAKHHALDCVHALALSEAIALIEPHVPQAPDPWLLEFDDLLARYVVQVTGSIQDWPPTKIALDALRNHVAAEHERAERLSREGK